MSRNLRQNHTIVYILTCDRDSIAIKNTINLVKIWFKMDCIKKKNTFKKNIFNKASRQFRILMFSV